MWRKQRKHYRVLIQFRISSNAIVNVFIYSTNINNKAIGQNTDLIIIMIKKQENHHNINAETKLTFLEIEVMSMI